MNSSSPESSRETEITLYNPSSEEAEDLDRASLGQNVLDIEIDRELAERLLEVSKHLGLNPTIVASRAIDLVCEEIGTPDEHTLQDEDQHGTAKLIQRFQARVDLLQALEDETKDGPDTSGPGAGQDESAASVVESETETTDGEGKKLWEVDEASVHTGQRSEGEGAAGRGGQKKGSRERLRADLEEQDSPPTLEFTVSEAAMSHGTLDQTEPDEGEGAEGDDERPKDWDAVESIIEAGEQARE